MNDKFKIDIIRHIMTYMYIQMKPPNRRIIFDNNNIDYWISTHYPIPLLSNQIYLLPEPFSRTIDISDINNDICDIAYTIINRYLNSTAFGINDNIISIYKDMYKPFIQLEVTPLITFGITEYEIFQIVDINKRIL